MERNHLCLKKDKRLLVLLALGVVILFADLNLIAKTDTVNRKHIWIELQGPTEKLYRAKLPNNSTGFNTGNRFVSFVESFRIPVKTLVQEVEKEKKGEHALAVSQDGRQDNLQKVSTISPRTAFFLGLPFSINKAKREDFTLIQGIGPVLAENIISYREMYGPITNENQVDKIPGIGPSKKQKLLNHCNLYR